MKVTQSALLNSSQAAEAKKLGATLARLRIARGMKQDQAALRAGLSRNTAYRLESKTLLELLSETDPALAALGAKERRRRARELSKSELEEIDF